MKTITLVFFAMLYSALAAGQQLDIDLKHFSRVVASPRVNVVLNKGNDESVRITYHGVDRDDINVRISGKTLRIFLTNARKIEPMVRRAPRDRHRTSLYDGGTVTAYVTYRQLKRLEIRGNQELTCEDPISSERFTICAYGENEIRLASLRTGYFKAKMYGENRLRIGKGSTFDQKYVLYGENRINAQAMRSHHSFTRIFGEGSLRINSSGDVLIDAFGEPTIHVDGGAQISRRLVIGDAHIDEIR